MDKQFNSILYNGCNYLSMLGLNLNHVSKRGPRSIIYTLDYLSASIMSNNLAKGKSAYQSSTHSHAVDPRAEKAVDGNRDPDFLHHSCTHTVSETSPFWVVDLGQVYRIGYVVITNRIGKDMKYITTRPGCWVTVTCNSCLVVSASYFLTWFYF